MTPLVTITSLAATKLQLMELVAAIDRRLPQVQRSGEATIATAAELLRIEAIKRIGEIDRDIAGRASADAQPVPGTN
jgi:hypothetical protein